MRIIGNFWGEIPKNIIGNFWSIIHVGSGLIDARFPNMITTVQCSICSQLNNKHRVVVTDFRLHHTCSIIILWLHSLSGVIRSLLCNPRIQPSHNNKVGGASKESQ